MHRKLRRNFIGVVAIEGLGLFSDSQVELGTPERGYAVVQDILIQRVDETIAAYRHPVWQYLDSGILNELTLTSQFIASGFYSRTIFQHPGRHERSREFRSRHACRLQRSLLARREVLDLLLDHLPNTFGYAELHVLNFDKQLPTLTGPANQVLCFEVVDHIDHEQRIPLGSFADQNYKLIWKPVVGKSNRQIFRDCIFTEV